jgi:hypothetical protein
MALWNGSAINTHETAFVFNQMATRKAIPIVRNMNGFLYAALGKEDWNATPGAGTGFKRLKKISGKNVEVTLLGELAVPLTTTDANQTLFSNAVQNLSFGAAEFPIAHYSYPFAVPDSELQRFIGDELKTAKCSRESCFLMRRRGGLQCRSLMYLTRQT